jgi:hypothetical protein
MGLGQNLESAGPLKTPMNLRLLWSSNSALPIGGSTHSWGLRQFDLIVRRPSRVELGSDDHWFVASVTDSPRRPTT